MKGRLARREYADLAYTGVGLLSRCVYTLFTCDLVRESHAGASRRDRTKQQYVNRWGGGDVHAWYYSGRLPDNGNTTDAGRPGVERNFKKKPLLETTSSKYLFSRVRTDSQGGRLRDPTKTIGTRLFRKSFGHRFAPPTFPGRADTYVYYHLMVFMGAGRQNQRRFFINGVANVGR